MASNNTKQCKTCIHTKVCFVRGNRENAGDFKLSPCKLHRTETISELPCNIGDPVYMLVYYKGGMPSHYRAKTCTGIHISYGKAVRPRAGTEDKYLVVNTDIGRAEHIPFHEIGKNVFFTEEEAKKAIEEKLNEKR